VASTKSEQEPMATDLVATGAEEPDNNKPDRPSSTPAGAESAGGFFTIYKRGQGYWTRVGTAMAVFGILLLTAHFLYENLTVWLPAKTIVTMAEDGKELKSTEPRSGLAMGIAAGFLLVTGLIAYRVMNKPSNVDFLIATDSEMKKVNWTKWPDLVGSTKVVIIFLFAIALLLFVIDQVFGLLFYLINVLKIAPFFWE
jgi:preprotein translocase SecE subunit